MDNLLLEAAKQIPSLAVLVWVVLQFSQRQKETVERFLTHLDKNNDEIKHLGDSCHTFQAELAQQGRVVLDRVTAAMDRNTAELGRAGKTLDRADRVLERLGGEHS